MPRKSARTPLRRRYRRPTGRKLNRRRRGAITIRQPATQPIANRAIVHLKYASTITPQILASGVANYQFRLNSLFDPDYTGGGHQPYGYDQLTTIYSQYRVFAATIKLTMLDVLEDSTSTQGLYLGTYNSPNVDALSGKTPFEIMELPYVKYRVCSANTVAGGLTRTVLQKVSVPKVMGVRAQQYKSDDLFMASTSGNPASQAFVNCFIADPSLGLVGKQVLIGVEITYHAEMMYPHILASS